MRYSPRMQGDDSSWTVRLIGGAAELPEVGRVSAVFLVGFSGEAILAVRNERGWDIPGGHVEPGEALFDALSRETWEEAAATIAWAEPFAVMEVAGRSAVMLFYATDALTLSSFEPSSDALERELIPVARFLMMYCGPQEAMERLVRGARSLLGSRTRIE